jgi:diguanylate cyclase (GGDEF)-like protein
MPDYCTGIVEICYTGGLSMSGQTAGIIGPPKERRTRARETTSPLGSGSPAAEREAIDGLLDDLWKRYRKEPEEALAQARAAVERAQGDTLRTARCLTLLTACLLMVGDIEAADSAAAKAVSLARESGDLAEEAAALFQWGQAALSAGNTPALLERSLKSLYLRRELGESETLAQTLNLVAVACIESGDHAGAERYLIEGLQKAREQGNHAIETSLLSNIAVIKGSAGHREEAAEYFRECARRHEECGENAGVVRTLTNLCGICTDLGDYTAAEAACERALTIVAAMGHPPIESWVRVAQSVLLREQGRLEEASVAVAAGLAHDETIGKTRYLPLLLGEQGLVALCQGDFETARVYLEQALCLSREMDRKTYTLDMLRYLAETLEQEGDAANALRWFKEFHALSQEMQTAASERRLEANLVAQKVQQAELEAQAARQDAARQRQHREELETANQALEAANAEKEALLTQLREQARRLEQLSVEDALTGLFNRRYLERYLGSAFALSRQDGSALTIAIFDLDNFKQINDRFSHQIGDEVLRTTARLLRESVRETDVAVRYGGEEFLLALPCTPVAEATSICERIRRTLEAFPWQTVSTGLTVTTSIGLAGSRSAEDPDRLLALADHHLYRAKTTGKNRLCY